MLFSTISSTTQSTPKDSVSNNLSIMSAKPTTVLPNLDTTNPSLPSTQNDLLDVSFYNSTSKTSFRLAVCLEGINCEIDSDQCLLIHQKCNQMFNVSVIPFKVRKKLSECSVDDIICHVELNPVKLCETSFVQCTKIVVPEKYLPTLKLMKFDDGEMLKPASNMQNHYLNN